MYHPAGSQSVAALHGLAASRGQNCLAGDRRAIAFQRSSRSLVRKWSFHAARLNFPRGEPLEPSFCIALRALSLSAARLCGPLPNRVLSWSSFITPSSRQCRRFSMAQCWRTTSLNRSGAKAVLSRQCAVSVLVLSAVSRTRCTLPMAASPGPWCSFLQPANLGGDGRRAGFNPPVIALHSRSGGHRLALRTSSRRRTSSCSVPWLASSASAKSPLFDDLSGNGALAVGRVGDHGGAFQRQHGQQLRHGGDLVRLDIGGDPRQHQTLLRAPGADHVQSRFAAGPVERAAQNLPIDGGHALALRGKSRHELLERTAKLLRIESANDRRRDSGAFRCGHGPAPPSRRSGVGFGRRDGRGSRARVFHRPRQPGLVVLDCEHVVRAAILYRGRNGGRFQLASMVTVQPFSARVESGSGIAVISLDFSAVARCPSTRPVPAAKADTRCSAVRPTPPERRLVLPSMATISSPRAGKTLFT
jgi:hypothetical protein